MVINKKVLLCAPVVFLGNSSFINYQDASGAENLGLEYIGGALKSLGADVKIATFSSEVDLAGIVENVKPDFVGFTSLTYFEKYGVVYFLIGGRGCGRNCDF